MPYIWAPAPVFLEHNGIEIYSIFKNDDLDLTAREYLFGYNTLCSDNGAYAFDVRDLKCFNPNKTIVENLIAAIDSGEIQSMIDESECG